MNYSHFVSIESLILYFVQFFLTTEACASKPWEVDLRDICQRLHCLFVCCKGQIIINATENNDSESTDVVEHVMSKKSYDPRLVWPYSILLCDYMDCKIIQTS